MALTDADETYIKIIYITDDTKHPLAFAHKFSAFLNERVQSTDSSHTHSATLNKQ
jgi:hypothetical protein